MDVHTPLPILFPKVQIPPSRSQLVTRQRLLEKLDGGLERKLTLVSAQAGYGKSTLLSDWAAGCSSSLGWVTLEAGDNDRERFFRYLLSAIQTTGANTASLEDTFGALFSLQPLQQEIMLAILVNQLPIAVERLVLVLDDYHHINNPDIHNFISALLDHLPPNIHLILSTRADPPLPLARLRAQDQLNEITEGDLRFTLEEAGEFFERVVGLRLTPEQLAELEARTEGWVTGLQLAGLSLKEREKPWKLIETLAGTHRYILDYLMQEVFSNLSASWQDFLLRVSILERLSPPLCDALVGGADAPLRSKEILEAMDASNLFLVPLDSQRQWYRFHPLFADFLRDRLVSQAAQEVAGLHQRAAQWYASNGLLSEAVEHSLASGDAQSSADLVEDQARNLLTLGEITTLNRWIAALAPEVFLARPRLGLARAWGMLMREPLAFLDTIEAQIQDIASGFNIRPDGLLDALFESEPGSERRSGLGEFAMLMAFARRDIKNVDETIQLFKAAYQYLPESEAVLRSFTLAGLGSTYARLGVVKQAEEAFSQAAQISLAKGSLFGYIACTDWQATMQAEQSQLRRAAATYQQAVEKLSGQGQRTLPLSGHIYVGLASVLLEQNDLAGALEKVQTGLKVGTQVRDLDALLNGYALQARIFLALNRLEEARMSVLAAEQEALKTKNPGCVHVSQAWKAYIALASGDISHAQAWAALRGLGQRSLSDLDQPPDEIESLTYARLLMAESRFAEALVVLKEALNNQESKGRMRSGIESLTLQALCLRSLGRTDEALRSLRRALLLAEPEGFRRVFIQEGPHMAALLRAAGAKGLAPNYVRILLEAFGQTQTEGENVLDPLSERELEVLLLMAQGLTNTEIAEQLVIAHSTVKTHVNRIFNKLGVRTRTQAVARARQLQILP